MSPVITIVIVCVVGFFLFAILAGVVVWRLRFKKSDPHHQPNKLDSIMPDRMAKNSFLAGDNRAQKFRDRAKSVTIGRPEFRLSVRKTHSVGDVGEQISLALGDGNKAKPGVHFDELNAIYGKELSLSQHQSDIEIGVLSSNTGGNASPQRYMGTPTLSRGVSYRIIEEEARRKSEDRTASSNSDNKSGKGSPDGAFGEEKFDGLSSMDLLPSTEGTRLNTGDTGQQQQGSDELV